MVSLAVGLSLLPPRNTRPIRNYLRRYGGWLLLAVVCGNLPDLDYLPGLYVGEWNAYHHTYTHSIGWTVLVSAALSCLLVSVRPDAPRRLHLLIWLSLLSHLPADWLCADNSHPRGIMIGWPFVSTYTIAPHTLFWELKKSDLQDALRWSNLWAFCMEVVFVLPVLLLVGWLRTRRSASLQGDP